MTPWSLRRYSRPTSERDRLRVVHVITTLVTGGAERQVERLAGASRHDVRVICLYRGGLVEDALRARSIPVQTLGMAGWRRFTTHLRLARMLRAHRPDVVHVHLLSGQLWGIPAARLAGVPVVLSTEHSLMDTTIEGRPRTRALQVTYRVLERLSTHTVAVSEATVARLADWGVRDVSRMSVLNTPIDFAALTAEPDDRDDVRAELGVPVDGALIGAVGRLEPVKRFDQLLRALAPLLRRRAHLVIVGDGPLLAQLQHLAGELGITAAVHFTGPRSDMRRLFAAMDVLVSASRDETFGMAVVEALGAGLPVVYAQCPALDGLDLGGRARRVRTDTDTTGEQTELARAVSDLLDARESDRVDPAGGRPQRGAPPEKLLLRYDAARTAAALDELYDSLYRAA